MTQVLKTIGRLCKSLTRGKNESFLSTNAIFPFASRQLKDRRKNRSRQLADKNSGSSGGGGILRFGSLSVKVKKTTEAFNNYFNSEKKHSNPEQPYSLPTIGFPDADSSKMPPPKFAPIKKRKSKRSVDYTKSVPTRTPSQNSIKEERSDSDGEYGFDSQWSTNNRA